MDIEIGRVQRRLIQFGIRLHSECAISFWIGYASFIVVVFGFAQFVGFPSALAVGVAIVVVEFVGLLALAHASVRTVQAVMITNDRLVAPRAGFASVARHVSAVDTALHSYLGDLSGDLLSLETKELTRTHGTESYVGADEVAIQALRIDLNRIVVQAVESNRRELMLPYIERLRTSIRQAETEAGAILDYVSSSFMALDQDTRTYARHWKPRPSPWASLEAHPVMTSIVVTVLALTVSILVGRFLGAAVFAP